MTPPTEGTLELSAGVFRTLTWGEGGEAVLFLHGLTAVADVWGPTIKALPAGRRFVALDQRGHGGSPHTPGEYSASRMAGDVREAVRLLGGQVHLVGHSMGARMAIIAASRFPELLRSVAIVDIGPEASKANIEATVSGISSRPERFASERDALAYAFRTRVPTESDRHIFLARLQRHADGSLTWRSPAEALIECVTRQRAQNYWSDWRNITIPALFVHGGRSNEVSDAIASAMRSANPRVRYERLEDIGHNIPLIAPEKLAALLDPHWTAAARSATR